MKSFGLKNDGIFNRFNNLNLCGLRYVFKFFRLKIVLYVLSPFLRRNIWDTKPLVAELLTMAPDFCNSSSDSVISGETLVRKRTALDSDRFINGGLEQKGIR